jgi:hypothetical protein
MARRELFDIRSHAIGADDHGRGGPSDDPIEYLREAGVHALDRRRSEQKRDPAEHEDTEQDFGSKGVVGCDQNASVALFDTGLSEEV